VVRAWRTMTSIALGLCNLTTHLRRILTCVSLVSCIIIITLLLPVRGHFLPLKALLIDADAAVLHLRMPARVPRTGGVRNHARFFWAPPSLPIGEHFILNDLDRGGSFRHMANGASPCSVV
jgi:hypothetical protein